MNPLAIKLLAGVAMLAGIYSMGYWRGHVSELATVTELRDSIKAANTAADAQLAAANGRTDEAQRKLDATVRNLTTLQGEFDAAHTSNVDLRADLAAARKRLPVAISSCRPTAPGAPTTVAGLGDQSAATADLDPRAASRVVELTDRGDQAIRRLNACITQYRAAQDAVN